MKPLWTQKFPTPAPLVGLPLRRYNAFMDAKGRVLLINPWIVDFAAHNLWIEPLGLLTLGAALRENGYAVHLVDCLAPHPGAPSPRGYGQGKFVKVDLPKPAPVAHVPRRFGRYGLPPELFDAALAALPTPDLVLVTSGMTYWYPGVVEAIGRVRARFGAAPVALGGVYAGLCPAHARAHSGADWVVEGPGVVAVLEMADQITGARSDPQRYADPCTWPAPAHDLAFRSYAAVLTSWGCPLRCTYCASHRLQPTFVQRPPQAVVDEIQGCWQRGARDVAFYDDALLVNADRHLTPILEGVLARSLTPRFHTPNGLHARLISDDLAVLMRRAGFVTVRLSLETTNVQRQQATGGKVDSPSFERAVDRLQAAGFGPAELGAYILAGLPGQPLDEVERTVRWVHSLKVQAKLALYSPIPGTVDAEGMLPPDADPLLHNDTVFSYRLGPAHVAQLQRIKQLAKDGNNALLRP